MTDLGLVVCFQEFRRDAKLQSGSNDPILTPGGSLRIPGLIMAAGSCRLKNVCKKRLHTFEYANRNPAIQLFNMITQGKLKVKMGGDKRKSTLVTADHCPENTHHHFPSPVNQLVTDRMYRISNANATLYCTNGTGPRRVRKAAGGRGSRRATP